MAELLKRQKLHGGAPKSSTSSGDLVNGTTMTNSSKDNIDPLENIDPTLDLGISDFKMDSDMAAIVDEALASIGDSDALGGSEDSIGNGNILGNPDEEGEGEEQYVKCPENIPPELLAYVEKIKDVSYFLFC